MNTTARIPVAIPLAVACLGIALFAGMDAAMKGLAIALGAYNAMLWRMAAGIVLTGALFLVTRSRWPVRANLRVHLTRGLVLPFMALFFFWGIARVPLAEGIALSFIAPLIALYLAAVLLGERIGRSAIVASLLGLAGVIVILAGRLEGGAPDREALLGIGSILISAVLYAWNLILQRQQAQIASPIEIAFLLNLMALLILLLAAPVLAAAPAPLHYPAIVLSAVLGLISVLLMSWAYARAEAQVLLPVEYTAFIWAAIMGWLFFAEKVTPAVIAGTLLIVTGCIVAARAKPRPMAAMEGVA